MTFLRLGHKSLTHFVPHDNQTKKNIKENLRYHTLRIMENKPKSCGSYGLRHIIFIMRNQKQRFYILLRPVKIISEERSESILIREIFFPEKRKLYITVMHCLFVCLL